MNSDYHLERLEARGLLNRDETEPWTPGPGCRLQASRWAVGTAEAKPTNLGPKNALKVSAAASVQLESLPPFRRG